MSMTYVGLVDGLDTWELRNDEGKVVGISQSLPAQKAVPTSVTAVQIRLWLDSKGVTLQNVSDAIAALPEETRNRTQIEWEYATEVHRNNSRLAEMAAVFGFDSAAIDQAFIEASVM